MTKSSESKLDKFYSAYSILTRINNAIGIIAVYIMMFIIVIDVFFRNFMPSPLQGIYEIIQWFLLPISCITFFGYAYASGVMPRVTMVLEKMKPSVRHWCAIISIVINIAMFAMMSYAGMVYAIKQLNKGGVVTIGSEHIIVWPMYFLIVLAFIMITLESVFAVIKCLKDKNRTEVIYND